MYRQVINALTLKWLLKPPDLPALSLGVGPAEVMEPIYGKTPKPLQRQVWRPPYNWTRKEAFDHGAEGPAVKAEDFPRAGWVGEPYGGLGY